MMMIIFFFSIFFFIFLFLILEVSISSSCSNSNGIQIISNSGNENFDRCSTLPCDDRVPDNNKNNSCSLDSDGESKVCYFNIILCLKLLVLCI
jgi:hypothetical protein